MGGQGVAGRVGQRAERKAPGGHAGGLRERHDPSVGVERFHQQAQDLPHPGPDRGCAGVAVARGRGEVPHPGEETTLRLRVLQEVRLKPGGGLCGGVPQLAQHALELGPARALGGHQPGAEAAEAGADEQELLHHLVQDVGLAQAGRQVRLEEEVPATAGLLAGVHERGEVGGENLQHLRTRKPTGRGGPAGGLGPTREELRVVRGEALA